MTAQPILWVEAGRADCPAQSRSGRRPIWAGPDPMPTLPKITIETSKETVDQFYFVFLFYWLSLFSRLIISGNKKELSQKKIKNNVKNNIKNISKKLTLKNDIKNISKKYF